MNKHNKAARVENQPSEDKDSATHQTASKETGYLTNNQGMRIADNQNSLKAGVTGPTLLEDFILREKIFHFDHERIPERIVHARGSGAHGFFEAYESLSEITKAAPFQKAGERTPVFVRFSTVAGGAGSVDTPRDVRGFAVKFYTSEGNWDLVGNNIPVFFIQDAIKFPDLVHAVKMEADRAYPQAASAHDTFWDFVSLMPETSHMIMWTMSDRAIPRSYRMMEGFGVHTFRLINEHGESTFVKFHWKPKLGLQSTVWDEALKLQAADNDYHRRDLYEAIENGAYPEWELGMQLFDQQTANSLPYDILDATKLIPEEVVPVKIVGRMVLDRNPDNFFAETEQVAFCPANIIPGIDFSDDPLLQGRLFSYLDTQKSRLGTANFHQIPVNAPKCPMTNFQRDGMMQTQVFKGRANYEPNSLAHADEDGGPRECPVTGFSSFRGMPEQEAAPEKRRLRPESFADHYSQARMFFSSQTENEQAHIASAIVFELSKVTLEHIPPRVVANLRNVSEELARRVADGLGIALPEKSAAKADVIDLDNSPALSIQKNWKNSLEGRTVGILVADGSDAVTIRTLQQSIKDAGGSSKLVADRRRNIQLNDQSAIDVDGQLAGTPSQLFDAVAVILSEAGTKKHLEEAAAIQWVLDAYGHLKAIGYSGEAKPLLDKAGIPEEKGISAADGAFVKNAALRFFEREAKVRSLN